MALSQTQIIQSLGEALTWFEKELSWGVDAAELRHLTGRIGELYAAMITRGQMAPDTNQRGYDVVAASNERISVKTITSSSHVSFKNSTLHNVDRIMILRLNVSGEEGLSIESILDEPIDLAMPYLAKAGSDWRYAIGAKRREVQPTNNLAVVASAQFEGLEIREFENGTILVFRDGAIAGPARPELRLIAIKIGVALDWETGTEKNTRQLGSDIIRRLQESSSSKFIEMLSRPKPLD
ncbi:MAG: hypothetical protein ABL912_00530 [Novosphingobium sp.]